MEIINEIFVFIKQNNDFLHISRTGYFEHIFAGFLIGGLISYLYFKKTDQILKSIFIGISTAFFTGLLKEYVDPLLGGSKDKLDLIYTVLGSIIGVTIFILMTYRKKLRT